MRELAELKGANFGCIVADPAWRFKSYGPAKDPRVGRQVERHYQTMGFEAIQALPVEEVAARDCHLFLWTTGPFLMKAGRIMSAWGFRYSAVAFFWAKLRGEFDHEQARLLFEARDQDFHFGLGFTTRHNMELCLLGRRGSPKRLARDVRELIVAPVRQHSRKPDEAYERIERYCAGPYLELFARTRRPGWTAIGDQVGKFKPICSAWPGCGCGTQSGPHTCEWKEEAGDVMSVTGQEHDAIAT